MQQINDLLRGFKFGDPLQFSDLKVGMVYCHNATDAPDYGYWKVTSIDNINKSIKVIAVDSSRRGAKSGCSAQANFYYRRYETD